MTLKVAVLRLWCMEITADNPLASWAFNVVDKYKSMTVEEIKIDLQKNALPVAVLMQYLAYDFNIATVIRSSNAFGAREVFYYGLKHIDKRGCTGTHKYTPIHHLKELDQIKELKSRYHFVGLENNIDRYCIPMPEYKWKENTLILLGSESMGLEPEILDLCDDLVCIPSRGSIRSLNAATAISCALYDFASKY